MQIRRESTRTACSHPPHRDSTVARLEQLEFDLAGAKARSELQMCFWCLAATHVFLFAVLVPRAPQAGWSLWLALGGIGTLAVWFSWTARPLRERLVRTALALICVYLFTTLSPSIQFPRGFNPFIDTYVSFQSSLLIQFSKGGHTPSSSGLTILGCWLVGAFAASYLTTWFSGYQLVAPGGRCQRKPLSIRTILLVTFLAAVASIFIRGEQWRDRLSLFVNGMTLGFLSSGIAWSVFQEQRWKRIAGPIVCILGVIAVDMFGVGILNAWGDGVLKRLRYVAIFAAGLSGSSLLSFVVLQRFGYRMVSGRRAE